jgi:hypothetical protein
VPDLRCPAGCGERIIWALTEAGNRQQLNFWPDATGTVIAYPDHLGTWRARTVTDLTVTPVPPAKRYMPHLAKSPGCRKPDRPVREPGQPAQLALITDTQETR